MCPCQQIRAGDTVVALRTYATVPQQFAPMIVEGQHYQVIEVSDGPDGHMVGLPLELPVTGGTVMQFVPVDMLARVDV